jgi:predicted protein tyrosine phosphatase
MSRADLAEPDPFDRPVAIVSVRNPGGPRVDLPASVNVRDVLRLEFEDVDDPSRGAAMTEEQGRAVLEFAARHVGTDAVLVCQCEAGVSRSAGIAAALARIHFGHDGPFHRTHRPNPWVRRLLLRLAKAAEGEAATSEVALLPTALPTAVLVRDGRTWQWVPRASREYPAGTLGGGDVRTLSAHVFVPLADRLGRRWTAREIGTWARRTLHAATTTKDALVVTRAGAWRERAAPGRHPGAAEPAIEVYVQTASDHTRDEWTRALRAFADALGARFHSARFDVVLTEDALMYKRAVWRPAVRSQTPFRRPP